MNTNGNVVEVNVTCDEFMQDTQDQSIAITFDGSFGRTLGRLRDKCDKNFTLQAFFENAVESGLKARVRSVDYASQTRVSKAENLAMRASLGHAEEMRRAGKTEAEIGAWMIAKFIPAQMSQ